ncbi:MAG: NAD(P)H-hydrate dehydratase [Oscillochloridaceae bacterium umkhey_bin13]
MKIVSAVQMRELEAGAVAAGATWDGLMEQAGWGVAQVALRLLGSPAGRHVLVLVGPGNNGGDGLVVARHLHDAGASVQLYVWQRTGFETDRNWQRCRTRGLTESVAAADPTLTELATLCGWADLIIDALLGMGASRSVNEPLARIITTVNVSRPNPAHVLAIDLPTGLHADTGAVLGLAIHAHTTVATGLPKWGVLLFPGRALVGNLIIAELGVPPAYLETIMSDMLTAEQAQALLPARPADAHKGSFGKLMVLAGSLHYPGAAFLACAGAARVGAGLVTLAGGRAVLGMTGRLPEATLLPLPEGDWGAVGPAALDELQKALEGYSALVFGPGIGQGEATRELLRRMVGLDTPKLRARVGFLINTLAGEAPEVPTPHGLPPTVLDADALNLLAGIEDWTERLPKGGFVLTPHPGEMRRLLQVDELPADALTVASKAAQNWGQVVVLKGASTVIAAPDGRTSLYDGANPALATAGTGDVLAGVIGGLLAQGLAPYEAAVLGVYLHGAAGARVRETLGEAGTLASDLLPELPRAIKALRG